MNPITRNPRKKQAKKNSISSQKLGNEAVRLSDLERNKFTEPINIGKLKLYFTQGREEWSLEELVEVLTRRDRKFTHAYMHRRNILCILCVFVLFFIHRFWRRKKERAIKTRKSEIAKAQYQIRVVIPGLGPILVLVLGRSFRVEAHMSLSFRNGSQGAKPTLSEDDGRILWNEWKKK